MAILIIVINCSHLQNIDCKFNDTLKMSCSTPFFGMVTDHLLKKKNSNDITRPTVTVSPQEQRWEIGTSQGLASLSPLGIQKKCSLWAIYDCSSGPKKHDCLEQNKEINKKHALTFRKKKWKVETTARSHKYAFIIIVYKVKRSSYQSMHNKNKRIDITWINLLINILTKAMSRLSSTQMMSWDLQWGN